jgi:predicted restriction endonuclease
MNILHKYNIRKEDKGVLNKDATSEEIMNYIISKNNQYSKAEKNELTNQYIRQYLSRMNIEYEEKEKSFFEIKISDAIYALKSRTYNGHYVFVEKSEIPDLSQNVMIALVEWSNDKPSNLYFIPMSEWRNPDITILKDRDYEELKSKPEWGIDINQTNKHELNRFLANKIIKSIKGKEDKKLIEEIENDVIAKYKETEKQALIKIRMGHSSLRKKMLNHKKECEICGIKNDKLLIISHIKPWAKSEDTEKLDPNNVLLLCSMHDTLFDKGLISFDDNGRILISSELDKKEQALVNINEDSYVKINSDKQIEFLRYHREHIFVK